jgi:hypothetical protein
VLIAISKPGNEHRPAPIDYRGLALIVGGVGLSVFGFQQSALWGWGNAAIEVCIAVGVVLLVVFYLVERRTEAPLMNVRIFHNQAFLVENIILGIAMMAFIPVFFFASIYGQIALGEKAQPGPLRAQPAACRTSSAILASAAGIRSFIAGPLLVGKSVGRGAGGVLGRLPCVRNSRFLPGKIEWDDDPHTGEPL